jgi:hypothetical protein
MNEHSPAPTAPASIEPPAEPEGDGAVAPALLPAIFVASAACLLVFAAPTIPARDGGELVAASASLGIAHPTGFVLDVLLWRAAMLVPVGDLAFRANAANALLGALCATLLARVALSVTRDSRGTLPPAGRFALAGATAVGLLSSSTILRAFTGAEVYASALCLSLLALRAGQGQRPVPALLALAGLSFAAHTTVRGGVLAALLALILHRRRERLFAPSIPSTLAAGALLALVAALSIAYLPIAARKLPWADWGGPTDLRGTLAHLTAARIRDAFSSEMGLSSRTLRALGEAATILRQDLGVPWLVLGAMGALGALRGRSVMRTALLLSFVADALYSVLLNPMGARDRQTLFLAEASLLALGAGGASDLISWVLSLARRPAAVVSIACGAMVVTSLSRFDRRQSGAHEGWTAVEVYGGPGAIGSLPPRAVLLCESDELCGGSLYAREVEGERPDAVVLPRQHLWDNSTWRRLRVALGRPMRPRDPSRRADEALRRRRLLELLRVFGPRVRWEQGDRLDERLCQVSFAPSESPVLARPVARDAPASLDPEATDAVLRWLTPRASDGALSRRIAASVLFNAGMRAAPRSLSLAAPLWVAALAREPEHVGSLTNLAVARAAEGALPAAIDLTERALSLDPTRTVAWQNLLRYVSSDPARVASVRSRAGAAGVRLDSDEPQR